MAGFIGSHLASALVADGHAVLGVDAFTPHYARSRKERNVQAVLSAERVELLERDLGVADIDDVVADSDGIFHLAGQPGVRDSWGSAFSSHVKDNLLATQRVADAASRFGRRLVFASSSSVYGCTVDRPSRESDELHPISPYGVTKLACEHLLRAYDQAGLDWVVLRYFTVFGPRQRPDMAITRMIRSLLAEQSFQLFGRGDQRRDFTYVDDAVRATILAMTAATGHSTFNVGGGNPTSVLDVIAHLEELTGRRLSLDHAPAASGDVPMTSSDTSKLRTELGWKPQTSLAEGLKAQLAWAEADPPTD
jgi:nucleoside-diphosphate-sugar epimerase